MFRKPVKQKEKLQRSGSNSTSGSTKASLTIIPAHETMQQSNMGVVMEDRSQPRDERAQARETRPAAPFKSPSYQPSMVPGTEHLSTKDRVYEHLDRESAGRHQSCGPYGPEAAGDREKDKSRSRHYDERPPQRDGPMAFVQRGLDRFSNRDSRQHEDDRAYYNERDNADEAEARSLRHELRRLKSEHKSQIQDLVDQLKVEREKSAAAKESADKMFTAMENKDLFLGRQATDEQLKTHFLKLMKQVTTWSVPFAQAKAPPSESALAKTAMYDLQKIVPHITEDKRFLNNLSNVRLFVRGFVSMSIAEMLFRSTATNFVVQDIWMERDLAAAMDETERKLYQAGPRVISYRELNDWRALTTSLISRLNTTSKSGQGMEGYITECSRRILEVIMPLAPSNSREDLSRKLEDILLEAVNLAQTLRHQRAAWSIRNPLTDVSTAPGAPILLDESVMQDELVDEDDSDEGHSKDAVRSRVDVFVVPALFKRGNSDGEQFDVETCVVKAKVRSSPPVNPAQAPPAQKYSRQPLPR